MGRFFKIIFPNDKSLVFVSNKGYAGLIDLVKYMQDREDVFVTEISFFEFVKHIVIKGK